MLLSVREQNHHGVVLQSEVGVGVGEYVGERGDVVVDTGCRGAPDAGVVAVSGLLSSRTRRAKVAFASTQMSSGRWPVNASSGVRMQASRMGPTFRVRRWRRNIGHQVSSPRARSRTGIAAPSWSRQGPRWGRGSGGRHHAHAGPDQSGVSFQQHRVQPWALPHHRRVGQGGTPHVPDGDDTVFSGPGRVTGGEHLVGRDQAAGPLRLLVLVADFDGPQNRCPAAVAPDLAAAAPRHGTQGVRHPRRHPAADRPDRRRPPTSCCGRQAGTIRKVISYCGQSGCGGGPLRGAHPLRGLVPRGGAFRRGLRRSGRRR